MVEVEAEAAPKRSREQLEHAAGAGAEVDEQLERSRAQRLGHGRLDLGLGDMQGADAVPVAGVGLEVGLRGRLALALAGPRRDARSRTSTRSDAIDALAGRAGPARRRRPASASRKYTQLPSGARSTRPASASSFRCRLMRGWLWPRMRVRSLTFSSPAASSTSMRSRVGSATAFRAAPMSGRPVARASPSGETKHIKISLCVKHDRTWMAYRDKSHPRSQPALPSAPKYFGRFRRDLGHSHNIGGKPPDICGNSVSA